MPLGLESYASHIGVTLFLVVLGERFKTLLLDSLNDAFLHGVIEPGLHGRIGPQNLSLE